MGLGRRSPGAVTSAEAPNCRGGVRPLSPVTLLLPVPTWQHILSICIKKNPRRVLVIYGSPKQREVIDRTEWLTPIGSELDDWYLIYESNPAV
jgi:hypothetical protein